MCIQGCELHAGLNARPRPPPPSARRPGKPSFGGSPHFFLNPSGGQSRTAASNPQPTALSHAHPMSGDPNAGLTEGVTQEGVQYSVIGRGRSTILQLRLPPPRGMPTPARCGPSVLAHRCRSPVAWRQLVGLGPQRDQIGHRRGTVSHSPCVAVFTGRVLNQMEEV